MLAITGFEVKFDFVRDKNDMPIGKNVLLKARVKVFEEFETFEDARNAQDALYEAIGQIALDGGLFHKQKMEEEEWDRQDKEAKQDT